MGDDLGEGVDMGECVGMFADIGGEVAVWSVAIDVVA